MACGCNCIWSCLQVCQKALTASLKAFELFVFLCMYEYLYANVKS